MRLRQRMLYCSYHLIRTLLQLNITILQGEANLQKDDELTKT